MRLADRYKEGHFTHATVLYILAFVLAIISAFISAAQIVAEVLNPVVTILMNYGK